MLVVYFSFCYLITFLLRWAPGVLSPAVKQAQREGNHPPPSSAEVEGGWSSASAPSVCIYGMQWNGFILFTLAH
jgi:hypothetical protein